MASTVRRPDPRPRRREMARRAGGILLVAALLAGLVVLVATPSGGAARATYAGWTHRLRDVAATLPEQVVAGEAAGATTETVLFVTTGDGGTPTSLVLAVTTDQTLAVAVPPDLFDVAPGLGELPLADAMRYGGPETLRLTVENVFDVRVDDVVLLPLDELPALVGGGVPIDLPGPLIVTGDDGSPVQAAAPGLAPRDPETIPLLLDRTDDPVADLARHAATWEAILPVLGRDPATIATVTGFATRGGAAVGTVLAVHQVEGTIAPVRQVGGASDRAFAVDADALPDFLDRRVPGAVIAPLPRVTMEVLNGNGRLRTTEVVAGRLIEAGYRLIRVDNADRFDHETTIVVAQGRENTEPAREVVRLLGIGELRLELRAPSGAVDISIIVGRDVPAGEG